MTTFGTLCIFIVMFLVSFFFPRTVCGVVLCLLCGKYGNFSVTLSLIFLALGFIVDIIHMLNTEIK